MILINEYWEIVEDSYDVMKLIEENMGREFANKVRKIYGDEESVYELQYRIYELENELEELTLDYVEWDSASNQIDELNCNLDMLKEYIDKYSIKTDSDSAYVSGLKDAYRMIFYGDEL